MRLQSANSQGTATARAGMSQSQEAEALLLVIQSSPRGIVVVSGAQESGKTRFIRELILPQLQGSVQVLFYDCATEMPEGALSAVNENGIVILDSFDRFLQIAESARTGPLHLLFSESRRSTLVLVVGNRSLPDIFDLRELAPDILEHVFQLSELRLSAELPRYSPAPDLQPLVWEKATLDSLEKDLARFTNSTVTPILVAVIDEGFRAGYYQPKRGLIGLLQSYLEGRLEMVREDPAAGENAVGIAGAILKELAADGRSTLTGIAETFGVPAEVPAACREALQRIGIIRDAGPAGLAFQPAQLQSVLEQWLGDDRQACSRSEHYLADGIEARRKVGTLLPRNRFDEIHAQRFLLRTTPEQAAFLTLCALRNYPDADPSLAAYWLRRIGDAGLEVNTLLEAVADPSDLARRRSASMLSSFDEPKVQGQLCLAALEDSAPAVRQQAVTSLATFSNKRSIRDVLFRAASERAGEPRIRAIYALHIFPDKQCADFLEEIVSNSGDSAVRAGAIEALGRTHCESGVAALVRVALRDKDQKDRDRAASALGRLGSDDLTEFGLELTFQDWQEQRPAQVGQWWNRLGSWPAALGMMFASLGIHGLPLLPFGRLAAAVFFSIEVGLIGAMVGFQNNDTILGLMVMLVVLNWLVSIVVGAWLSHRKQPPAGSFKRLLSTMMLGLTMLTSGIVFHGIGHLITGRKRRALQLLGIEVLAIAAAVATHALQNMFMLGIGKSRLDAVMNGLYYLYLVGGFTLSWLAAVSWLIMDEGWGRRGPWVSETHSRVIRALLTAPESAGLLRRNLDDASKAKCARVLLTRFGDAVPGAALFSVFVDDLNAGNNPPPEIVRCLSRYKDRKGYDTVISKTGDLLEDSTVANRTQFVRLLASNPTEGSIRCLIDHRLWLRAADRFRLLVALIVRPFRGWHWTVRIAAVAAAGLAMLIMVDGVRTARNPALSDIKQLRRGLRRYSGDMESHIKTTAELMAETYPAEAAEELVPAFLDATRSGGNATALAPSLGMLATSQEKNNEPDVSIQMKKVLNAEAKPVEIDQTINGLHYAVHAQAVAALICVVPGPDKKIRSSAIDSLSDAAERGGSRELVTGLAALYDALEAGTGVAENEQIQGTVVRMMTAVAKRGNERASRAATEAINGRADNIGKLLRRSSDIAVKQSALDTLQLSGSDTAVTAIKNFILSESVRRVGPPSDAARVNPPDFALAVFNPVERLQSKAVDVLRSINTQAAISALEELRQKRRALPTVVADKFSSQATSDWLTQSASSLEQKGRIKEALQFAREAVQSDPQSAEAHVTLGSILFRSGAMPEALAEFQAAASLRSYWRTYYMQAVILRNLKRWHEAEMALDKAITLENGSADNYTLLRLIYTDQNRIQGAVDALHRYGNQYPTVPAIYSQLAYVYHEQVALSDPKGGFENAYVACRRWLELVRGGDPAEAVEVEVNFDETRLTTGRYAEVLRDGKDLLSRGHLDVNQRMTLSVLLLSAQVLQGDKRDALATLDSLRDLYATEFVRANVTPNWVYDGTVFYLQMQPKSPTTDALTHLVRAINESAHNAPGGLIQINNELFDNLRRSLQSGN